MSMSAAITHPVMQEMILSGCKKQKAIYLAFQTYMELCEVEILWNVKHHFNDVLDLIYLSAADKPNGEDNLYVPISHKEIITPEWMLAIREQMEKMHDNSKFTFVIRVNDSTSVHYNISPGLVAPPSPETARQKRLAGEKRQLFEHEVKKRKHELINAAASKVSKNNNLERLDKSESTTDKTSEEIISDGDDVCEVPITVTIDDDDDDDDEEEEDDDDDDDDDEDDDSDSNQSKQVEVIEL